MKKINFAIVGATGAVGRKVLEILNEQKISCQLKILNCWLLTNQQEQSYILIVRAHS